ncbi:MAG: tetratricopeptide repeat protein [Deltaproteobacteria bacterium]|nr:tetratricopeptide repeat protein [Deltaproteobacteria bacterium]
MTYCELLDLAQEERLDSEQRDLFFAHLDQCASCREAMSRWEKTRRNLHSYMTDHSPDPSGENRAKLLAAADGHSSLKSLHWVVAAAAVIAVVGILLVVFAPDATKDRTHEASLPRQETTSFDYQLVFPLVANAARSVVVGHRMQGNAGGYVVRFRHSLLGLDESTEMSVVRSSAKLNSFVLHRGILAVELPHVENRETLKIKAGLYTATVMGTVFWVEVNGNDQVELGVVRGEISVQSDSGETWRIQAGTKRIFYAEESSGLETVTVAQIGRVTQLLNPQPGLQRTENDGEGLAEEMTKAVSEDASSLTAENTDSGRRFINGAEFSVQQIEQWIIQKQYQKAHSALQRKLKANSSDRTVIDLLATCYRKQGKYRRASEMYSKLTAMGSPADMNSARYKLSVIYQEYLGDHGIAVDILKTYLSAAPGDRPNTLEARLRLANSLKHLGRSAEYRQTLQTIISAHPGTRGAEKAKQLLAEIQ